MADAGESTSDFGDNVEVNPATPASAATETLDHGCDTEPPNFIT